MGTGKGSTFLFPPRQRGADRYPKRSRHSRRTIMNSSVDILLVEDNQDDIDLALHALRQGKLANSIFVVRDGEEALDFLFCRGQFLQRNIDHPPKVVLLDLKLPKVDGLQVLKEAKGDL